jgi:hypothetical protein
MIKWLKEVISDERGYQSSKRIIAMVGSATLFLTLIVDWFFNVSVSDGVVSAVMTIICIGLGTSTIDKFSPKNEK